MSENGESGFLSRLLGPAEPEVTCDECFERLDEYVDRELAGDDVDARMPGMHAHFQGCPACAGDHASLLEFVRSQAR